MISLILKSIEAGIVPDALVRLGIQELSAKRLQDDIPSTLSTAMAKKWEHVEKLRNSPIAIETQKANEQHYELPPEFFKLCLGNRRKYSACTWNDGTTTLDEAEVASLKEVTQRAQLQDGLKILELGCGWGSLTLYMAENYPNSEILAVSNSAPQRGYILSECEKRGLKNVRVLTQDVNHLELDERFDRVMSIEMLEHVRNYDFLFKKITMWMNPGALFFVHIFTHKSVPYFFEVEGDDNWMGRYFFTGGQMPSSDLLLYFKGALEMEGHWVQNGTHYAKTSNAWLRNMDKNKSEILKIFTGVYGKDSRIWWNRWRVFYMAVAELFDYNRGEEWCVTHHVFKKV